MQMLTDLVRWDAAAVAESRRVLGPVPDLDRPTPCAGWTLRDLLAHMTVQHRGFAVAVRGAETEKADWVPVPSGSDPVADYADACAQVGVVFAALADPSAPVLLPELRSEPVAAAVAVSFHLLDYVVHSWDVAVTLGVEVTFVPDSLDAVLAIARRIPGGAARTRPDASFAPVVARASGATAGSGGAGSGAALDQVLRLTGRDPARRP